MFLKQKSLIATTLATTFIIGQVGLAARNGLTREPITNQTLMEDPAGHAEAWFKNSKAVNRMRYDVRGSDYMLGAVSTLEVLIGLKTVGGFHKRYLIGRKQAIAIKDATRKLELSKIQLQTAVAGVNANVNNADSLGKLATLDKEILSSEKEVIALDAQEKYLYDGTIPGIIESARSAKAKLTQKGIPAMDPKDLADALDKGVVSAEVMFKNSPTDIAMFNGVEQVLATHSNTAISNQDKLTMKRIVLVRAEKGEVLKQLEILSKIRDSLISGASKFSNANDFLIVARNNLEGAEFNLLQVARRPGIISRTYTGVKVVGKFLVLTYLVADLAEKGYELVAWDQVPSVSPMEQIIVDAVDPVIQTFLGKIGYDKYAADDVINNSLDQAKDALFQGVDVTVKGAEIAASITQQAAQEAARTAIIKSGEALRAGKKALKENLYPTTPADSASGSGSKN